MNKWLAPLLVALVCAAASHAAVLHFAPSVIMGRALDKMAARGVPVNGFSLGPRTTPQTQTVVRPSPDMAYSACLFDLAKAPRGLRVRMNATPGYASLSFFDARTNNFLTVRGNGETREVILLPPGSSTTVPDTTVAPSTTGVILIRRLAPTAQDYAKVTELAREDGCDAI